MFEKEYNRHGIEFLKLADIVTGISQYSNIEIFGTKYLKYMKTIFSNPSRIILRGVHFKRKTRI